jgi:Fur family iron response transcriptional regulator
MPVIGRHSAIQLLRRHGITPTPQRTEIARLLLSRCQHLSADQVLERLRRRGATVSKATVYNTLRLFAGRGIVRQVLVDPMRVFYDSNTSAHHHIYNVDDGTLIDVDTAALSLSQVPELPAGTKGEGIDIIVRVRNDGPASAAATTIGNGPKSGRASVPPG